MGSLILGALIVFFSVWPAGNGQVQPSGSAVTEGGETKTAGDAHLQIDCGQCHWGAAEPATDDPTATTSGGQCLTCHGSAAASTAKPGDWFHRQTDRNCADCHSFHYTDQLKIMGRRLKASVDESVLFQCAACHNAEGSFSYLSAGHLEAAEFYHANSAQLAGQPPSSSCLSCHADQPHPGGSANRTQTAIAINVPASHPIGIAATSSRLGSLKALPDARIPLWEGLIECQSCHLLTSGAVSSLVNFEFPYDLCQGCHTQGVPPEPIGPLVDR